MATSPTQSATMTATKSVECWYEYSPTTKATIQFGLRRIDDPEDPRWEGELMQAPFNGSPQGYLQVATVTRLDGEIIKSAGICGYSYHMNKAREFMREFKNLQAAGSRTPWDQERHYRTAKDDAERLSREGRLEELEILKKGLSEMLKSQTGVVTK